MTLYVGCDPGLTGAIAVYDPDLDDLVLLHDMPIDAVVVSGKERGRIAELKLLQLLWMDGRGRGAKAFIEWPEARPLRSRNKQDGTIELRQPGAAGMLNFGITCGTVRMACIANCMSVVEVRPGTWKRAMHVSAGKDEARRIAADTFPRWGMNFQRKKDDGRAEAALIAKWGCRIHG